MSKSFSTSDLDPTVDPEFREQIHIRPRRNRRLAGIRNLNREHRLHVDDLIMPLFVIDGENQSIEVQSMPGIYRYSADNIEKVCAQLLEFGVNAVALFPALDDQIKDRLASESTNPQGLYQKTIRRIKERLPEMIVISDVAMDPYSSDGHDGLVSASGEILNDETLPILGEMAVSQVQAGADIVAPSDMMDARVAFLRKQLDAAGYADRGIMAYTAKYASAFYGPFRDALDSAPKHGDKKTYQMDPANVRESMREVVLDIQEGADMVMVKPGLPYLDVVRAVSEISEVPVAVYNVSGEYAMIQAAARNGWLDYKSTVMESLTAFKRAGADMILSYHSLEAAAWLAGKDKPTIT